MTPLTPSYGPWFRPLDRLTGEALAEWGRTPLALMARHFQTLHRLHGVAGGLIVTIQGGELRVSPGVAFDGFGRPLHWSGGVVEESRISDEFRKRTAGEEKPLILVLRGAEPERLDEPNPPEPTPQTGSLALVDGASSIKPWEVSLARLAKRADGSFAEPDLSVRPLVVRSFRRPHIATGTLPAGTTAVPLSDRKGWQAWIPTLAAGFLPEPRGEDSSTTKSPRESRPPVYLATIGGPTVEDALRFRSGQTVLGTSTAIPPPGAPLATISQPSRDGFLLTVTYDPSTDADEFSATPLDVWWMGVEQRPAETSTRKDPINQTEVLDMGRSVARRKPPWPDFSDGERLTAADLNNLQDAVRELLWIHNRSLHDWGVAEGCAVRTLADGPGVAVTPGYALDIQGREVIISDPRRLDVPARKAGGDPNEKVTWWVTASYAERTAASDQTPASRREGAPERRLPEAAVGWRNPQESDPDLRLAPGLDVILATVELQNGKVLSITTAGRRSAGPLKQPYVFAGRQTLSKPTTNGDAGKAPPTRAGADPKQWTRIQVDTSEAGFVGSPRYLFTIEWDPRQIPANVSAQPYIEDPQPGHFYLSAPASWFGDGSDPNGGGGGLIPWSLLLIILLFLALALPGLFFDDSRLSWVGGSLCALVAAAATLVGARKARTERSEPPAEPAPNGPVSWDAALLERLGGMLGSFLPVKLFTDPTATPGARRLRLTMTSGMPILMLLVQLLRPADGDSQLQNFLKFLQAKLPTGWGPSSSLVEWASAPSSWVWGASIVCAVLAAAPSVLTAIQKWWRSQSEGRDDTKPRETTNPPTIAWMGVES